jgi:hypothetical protein
MALQRRWIQTATIAVDAATGAILVTGAGGGSGVEIVGLKNGEGTQINPATKEAVDAIAAALVNGSDSAAALLADTITAMQALRTAISPPVCTPLGTKLAQGAWDAEADELVLPANTELLHVHVSSDGPAYLLVDDSTDDPATEGALYEAGQTHVIRCRNASRLHYRRYGEVNTVISVTAFGA